MVAQQAPGIERRFPAPDGASPWLAAQSMMRRLQHVGYFRALALTSLQLAVAVALPISLMMLVGVVALLLIPVAVPIWAVLVGHVLLSPTKVGLRVLRCGNLCCVGMGFLLCAYGKYCIDAAEKSAQAGGGLLGAYGLLPLGVGMALCIAGLSSLLILWQWNAVERDAA